MVLRGGARFLGALLMGGVLVMHRSWPVDPANFASMVTLSLIGGLFWHYHVRHTPVQSTNPQNAERLIWATSFLAILGVQAALQSVASNDVTRVAFLFMAPPIAATMLVSALLGPAHSLVALTITSLLLGVSGALPIDLLAATWLAGAVSAHVVNPLKRRNDLFRAVSVQVLANAAIAACTTAVAAYQPMAVLQAAVWGSIAAVIATSIFWLGVVLLERAFGIVSDWTLLELCSPEQPLIRELCLRAPGTYAHSVMVGNLAESAARAIGANPLLCRALAYYHDIGKMMRPSYYIENQAGDNVHDDMSPTLSAQVIAAHVKDGLSLAHQHRLPPVILDGIAQHHGTSLIRYFFVMALKESREDEQRNLNLESLFRYEGPKPQSRETAILHLADILEAASRTWPRNDSVENMVAQQVERTRADGQLDESDLTFRELQQIRDSFAMSLSALRHERISYPSMEGYGEPTRAPGVGEKRIVSPS